MPPPFVVAERWCCPGWQATKGCSHLADGSPPAVPQRHVEVHRPSAPRVPLPTRPREESCDGAGWGHCKHCLGTLQTLVTTRTEHRLRDL